jgi:hypothetical protein
MYVMHSTIASLYQAKCKKNVPQTGQTMDETHQCISALDNFQKIVFQSFFADDTILVMGWNICTLNTVKSRTIWFPSGK